MENLTEMVFILDRSGSMAGLEKDTIGGFNSLLEKQKKEKGKALVTTMLFDDDFTLVHDRQPIHRVAHLPRSSILCAAVRRFWMQSVDYFPH